jgi:prophage tail gpP-like protein
MGPEIVTIGAGGRTWTAFKKVEVNAALNEAARSFSFVIAAEGGATSTMWTFKAGTPITISFNGDLVFTGYVDRYQPQLKEHSSAEIHVSGRGKSQDVIDSSAIHPTGRFENQTVLQIGQALDKFGVGISTDQKLDPIPFLQLTPGETVFRCLEKLCRSQGVTLAGQPDGSIRITNAGNARHTALVEGRNIKEISADHNWAQRHSHVTVRGQRPVGHGKDNLQVEQTATDETVGRYRPVVVVQDNDTDTKRAKKRAEHRRDREAGRSISAQVTVQGFHDDGGTLWTPGGLVWVESPFAGVVQDMVIEKTSFEQERDAGSITKLSLVDPQAYGGKAGKGGQSNAAWSTDAGS